MDVTCVAGVVRPLFVALALLGGLHEPVLAADDAGDYRLGPQDRVKIRVYDWRPELGETHEWEALTGDFVIGAAGTVSLPLVGEIEARGLSTAQLSKLLAERLQAKVGLAHPATASVEMKEYRPFYVLGAVGKPGEYAYRPDLTVLQAVTVAGGLERTADVNLLDFEHQALVNRGDLRGLVAERTQLLLRQARLTAEIDGGAFELPDELKPRGSDPAIVSAMRGDQRQLEVFNASLASQADQLQKSRALLQQELIDLTAKDAALGRQIDATVKELTAINGLVLKGLVITPRQTALQQNQSQFESARLDVGLATLRARQQIAQIDRDATMFRDKARETAMNEAADVRARLAAIAEKMQTAQDLLLQWEVRAPDVALARDRQNQRAPIYFVTRAIPGSRPTTFQVHEDDAMLPGDTLKVQRAYPDADVTAAADR